MSIAKTAHTIPSGIRKYRMMRGVSIIMLPNEKRKENTDIL